ncbi:MAG: type II toxin-antitoxin system RelE/ParE family toxin [Lachnospiraceae bacterium]|nr:type II toxin-antitoxin system RelE/ParE family toxin [Lachnospiraceae bacterium]
MKIHKVTVVPEAKEKMREYLSYLLFVLQSEQAYDAVKKDYHDTIDELSKVAGAHQEPPEPELAERGLKRMHFLRHNYVMLYEMDGDEAVVDYIFHESEDYKNKLN